MFRPVQTIKPAAEFLTLEETKVHLHVEADATGEDNLILNLITAVVAHLDGYSGILGRCLVNQTWRQDYSAFASTLRLPFPNVSSVTLKYYDSTNVLQTVSSTNYERLEDERGSFVGLLGTYTTPTTYAYRQDPVQVTMVAGYGDDPDDVPGAIKSAALLTIGHLYANREATSPVEQIELPMGARALLSPLSRKAF